MAKTSPPAGAGTPGTKTIHFEAELPPTGNAFTMNADGEARFSITVPASVVKPLAEAMAGMELRGTTFIVQLTYPDRSPSSS